MVLPSHVYYIFCKFFQMSDGSPFDCFLLQSLKPHWDKAAGELKGKVKLGAVDATVHASLAQKYGVQGYPTIKYFPSGKKGDPEEYDGGRTANDIVSWALERHTVNIPAPGTVRA
jgi:protein disulfide-isomerase A6